MADTRMSAAGDFPSSSGHSGPSQTSGQTSAHHYALYRCISKKPRSRVSSLGDNANSEHHSPERSSDGYVDFSLSVVAKSLDADEETCLRSLISKKLGKGSMHSDIGHISSVTIKSGEGESVGELYECYHYMLQPKSSPDQPTEGTVMFDFIICFLSKGEGSLDLFKHDLDQYCAALKPHIDCTLISLDSEVLPRLERWYKQCVGFMTRCLELLGTNLQFLIHAAMLNSTLVFKGATPGQERDIRKFVSCCGLHELTDQASTDSNKTTKKEPNGDSQGEPLVDVTSSPAEPKSSPSVSISIDDDVVSLSHTGCNNFCSEIAKAVTKADCDAVSMRGVVDRYKLQAIQDLNTLKRMISQAETNQYALYRAFHFLKNSGNDDVLLYHAKMSDSAIMLRHTASVISVLEEYTQETLGSAISR